MQEGKELTQEVRAGFIKQGTSLAAYCRDNNIDSSNVYKALRGKWNGKKSQALIKKLIDASKVDISKTQDS